MGVVNVVLSLVTTPLINAGPCSGARGASTRWSWVNCTSGAGSSGTDSVNAESWAVRTVVFRVVILKRVLSRRRWVTGSTSKAVSSVSSLGARISGRVSPGRAGVSWRRISRARSNAYPSKFSPHQGAGEAASRSQAFKPMPHTLL